MSSQAHTVGRSMKNSPMLALRFRAFCLGAAVFVLLALPLWVAVYEGLLHPRGYLTGVAWHSQELVFGLTPAVIAGFLLTAVRNWTG